MAAGLIWRFVYDGDYGLLAKLAVSLGFTVPYVLADRDLAMYAVLVVIVWKYFGFHMMLYIAGLQQIDPNLYEAAHMDGATGRQMLCRVTLPLLAPTIRLSMFFAVLGSIQLFDLIMPLTKGGPSDSTQTMVTYLYSYGVTRMKIGFGSAVGQDPDGTWIRIMGCDEDSPAGTPSGAPAATERAAAQPPIPSPPAGPVAVQEPPIAIDIAALRAAPPLGRHARLEGYVVDSYRCPPCPHGAMCKPCVMSTAIFVADVPEHARFSWTDPPTDVAVIAVDDPAPFEHGVRYRFEVAVPEHARAGDVDATLIRSQRADEPIWAEPVFPSAAEVSRK